MASMQNILFLDVETVSQFAGFEELDPHGKKHWQQKINYFAKKDDHPWTEEDFARSYSDKAAIYAEFGKVIVISAGILNQSDNQQPVLRKAVGDQATEEREQHDRQELKCRH